ncbi:spermidine synthase [Flavobacterium branchiophilum]|uniref:Methyltransferase family protein n=2 Tax=Flavobacterium branchiophilum TaxID=55197 RepID=A0A543G875_9FLAO|nr:fused MFS/spermidine synthase [Flavobacterium branchiophilum]OXA81939.1 spermidine synthase [Flavobacterium branchiophilum] [Flavobacterium branchiophilum NBRC 15030 = ATCC 35035]TQM42282.1 methyltransferase family protein [Flavobacterium branchiophilum]GEM54709.1 spermidine synthase [Flavobacterium branchiophilum NBRC 15030 = ATCC 35035]
MFKKIASYLFPIKVWEERSAISKTLEVTWNNGTLVLDSKNANYSYGSLQRILKKGLKVIGYQTIHEMNQILLLGVAGGSVIKTLVDEVGYKGCITGVEIDEKVIQLSEKYFKLSQYHNLKLELADASVFIQKKQWSYDLIIIDVFHDLEMPSFLFEHQFWNNVKDALNSNGYVVFNTIVLHDIHQKRNQSLANYWEQHFEPIQKIAKLEKYNELFILKKKFNN